MFTLFKSKLFYVISFFWMCSTSITWADSHVTEASRQNELCYFYQYIKGSTTLSDPANQVSHFIKNRWIELENDLALGEGDELTYLRGLAMCQYVLPEKLWENKIKGLPYEQRAETFTTLFFSECFCQWPASSSK